MNELHRLLLCSPLCLLASTLFGCTSSGDTGATTEGAGPDAELPVAALQRIVDELPRATGAPGAVLAVSHAGRTWSGAAGLDSLAAKTPMRADRRFRAASLTKMFTGVVIMQLVQEHKLSLDARLSGWYGDFPRADAITVDMLLSHTAGVSTTWLEDPKYLGLVTNDLTRRFTPDEVIAEVAQDPPAGEPGHSGMRYANPGFILLGEVAAQAAGAGIDELIEARIIEPLGLDQTSYQFDDPPDLAHGYFELGGSVLDTSDLPQQAIVSLAGAAGALHSSAGDLVRFMDALFQSDALVSPASREHMRTEGEPGSGYGHALMAFCPCPGSSRGLAHEGFGHGGNLPGYWSLAVHYPAKKLSVAMMINRDMVKGVAVDRSALDAAALAVFQAIQ